MENQGIDQVVSKVTNSDNTTGYSYIGIDGPVKNGAALRTVDICPTIGCVGKSNTVQKGYGKKPSNIYA